MGLGGRIWVFGGLCEDTGHSSEIWWLDLKGSTTFESQLSFGTVVRNDPPPRYAAIQPPVTGTTGYAANSSSVQTNPTQQAPRHTPFAPGSISSLKFVSSPNLPTQAFGTHFHAFTSGYLLDFVTPAATLGACETSLSALDLETLRWQKLVDGKDLFSPNYIWHYCAMNDEGTHAWLLGCPNDRHPNTAGGSADEYLSDVLPIDLRKLSIVGNSMTPEPNYGDKLPASDAHLKSHLSGIGADLARVFDQEPATGSGCDFVVTAEPLDDQHQSNSATAGFASSTNHPTPSRVSRPIHVHRLILSTRWPHFQRLYSAQMSEFHTRKLHIPEPYPSVRAFLYYLYTDSIASSPTAGLGPTLEDIAGMLVMSNIYGMPRLRMLCVARLGKDLDVDNAATIWSCASTAQEDWLRVRAARFIMATWGRIVRTDGFKALRRQHLLELCEEVDAEGRVLSGEELENYGSGRVSWGLGGASRKRRVGSEGVGADGGEGEGDEGDDDGMEVG